MKKWVWLTIVFILSFFLAAPGAWCQEKSKTPAKRKETQAPTIEGRAVSLRVLQERLKAYEKKGPYPNELLQLVGLKRVIGYVVDEANHDLILIGQIGASLPRLYLEDFVVGLRNTWLKYATLKGNTYYYSDPGCSIDPDPQVINRLQIVANRILGQSNSGSVERGIKKWHKICRSPQQVRVLGIPFHTHFSWVMVKADYDMKRLVDGSDTLDIPGFASLTDITLGKAKSDIIKRRPISIPLSSMNRFWFYPGKNLYEEDKGIITIKKCHVVLLTEEEYLGKRGNIVGKRRPSPLAQSFVEGFTGRYAKVAKQSPIYTELESLFRFVALAKIMKFKSPHEEAALELGYLLDHYPIPETSVSQLLPGRSNVKHFKHRRDFQGGYEIAKLWLPSCGGVGININISQENFIKDTTGRLAEIRAMVLKARPSPDALYWDYPRKKKVKLEQRDFFSEALALKWPGNKDHPNL